MYGMVNNAIKNLITDHYGEEAWEGIHAHSGVDDEIFISMNANPDEPTYNMIVTASEKLGVEAGTLLEEIGEYWLLYTAQEGYGEMLDMFGNTMMEFLQNLNHLHSRVGSVMPEFQPPTFECEKNADGNMLLHYYSDRPGLSSLVIGIMKGLCKKFNEPSTIEKVAFKDQGDDHDIFEISAITTAA